jgi:hypothetical protein
MAELIANDWKAINDRMQQIQAERSPSFSLCRKCSGRGWIPSSFRGYYRVDTCDLCQNPKDLPEAGTISGR